VERTDVVVVGGGVSGLSAAWRLRQTGLDVEVLELGSRIGGTSAWGDDGATPYPWGGHYLPAPNVELRATLRLLEELGVVHGWDAAGRPQFDAEMLCHAPEERIFYLGHWFSGLIPWPALTTGERDELQRFRAQEEELTEARGRDGRFAFQLPFVESSRDHRYLELDRISMAEWLRREGYRSPFLKWYVRYATLDDFGADLSDVSAWAGLHYFAARKLHTEQLAGSNYLVWPEGNGWLVRKLLGRLDRPVRRNALVQHLRPRAKGGVEVRYLDTERFESRRLLSRAAIVATPTFVAQRLLAPAVVERGSLVLRRRASAPWLVANLHLRRPPEPNLAWDSVVHGSHGLGYVDAAHQLTSPSDRRVWSYFRAYGDTDVANQRMELLGRSWQELASEVLLDLAPAHPELADQTERLDVMIWGHGMPRPRPGFLGRRPFDSTSLLDRHIAFAHVDQTGFALFEEANYRGVRAAEAIADALDVRRGESWL
jgi:phytoene dehydrogenase-like protein